jgi:hypothetical protein
LPKNRSGFIRVQNFLAGHFPDLMPGEYSLICLKAMARPGVDFEDHLFELGHARKYELQPRDRRYFSPRACREPLIETAQGKKRTGVFEYFSNHCIEVAPSDFPQVRIRRDLN